METRIRFTQNSRDSFASCSGAASQESGVSLGAVFEASGAAAYFVGAMAWACNDWTKKSHDLTVL